MRHSEVLATILLNILILMGSFAAWAGEISDACKTHPYTAYKVDQMTGDGTATLESKELSGWLNPIGSVDLGGGFGMKIHVDSSGNSFIEVVYVGNDWFFIERDAPLRIKSDGEIYEYPARPQDNSRVVRNGGGVFERQWYNANIAGLTALANDRNSLIRIVGSDGYVDRTIKAKKHARMADWIRACIVQ